MISAQVCVLVVKKALCFKKKPKKFSTNIKTKIVVIYVYTVASYANLHVGTFKPVSIHCIATPPSVFIVK